MSTPKTRELTRRSLLLGGTVIGAGLLTGCTNDGAKDGSPGASAGDGGPDELFAETASFETIANIAQRIMVGITTKDGRVLHGGSVRFVIRSVEAVDDRGAIIVDAPFLAVPRSATPPPTATIGGASDGIGVYSADGVVIPKPGFWTIRIEVEGKRPQTLETAVEVIASARVPGVGEKAPLTDNPIAANSSMPIEAIDSRSGAAGLGAELADPLLHRESVKAILTAKRPCVVIVSTPTFCSSKFCGPLTDVVNDLAQEASDAGRDTGFVHLEVWRSFERLEVNKFAADWILPRKAAGNEPWVFVIDRTGTITHRWDNLVTESDLRQAAASVTA